MIVTDLQPVSIVEDEGFQKFVKTLDPKYTIPSRRKIMNDLPVLYETKKKRVMDILAKTKWCSITTDLWTSSSTMGYITLTCHYISADWTMESLVLKTAHVPGSHTSTYLTTELKKITDEWNVTSKVHCAITDGASNIKGAIKLNHWNNLVCIAHSLNLVVTCALNDDPEAKEVIEKVKHMVTYFHKSTLASEKLREIQKRLDLPEHKLIQQVDTRWNSTFYMLERYLHQNEAVRTALCMQDRNDLILSSEKNSFIAEMIRILRPFEAVTTELSAEKYVSASKIIPLVRGLQKLTASNCTTQDGICSLLSQRLTSQMASRFQNLEEKIVIGIATLLDPRFKKIPFSNATAIQQMKRQIIGDASALIADDDTEMDDSDAVSPNNSNNTSTIVTVSSPVWEIFDQQVAASSVSRTHGISSLTELEQFFKAPLIPRTEDPLKWWKNNSSVFPSISKVAKVYLSTVATLRVLLLILLLVELVLEP